MLKRIIKTLVIILISTIGIILICYGLGLRLFVMSTNSSMYPTIKKGDYFIVSTKVNSTDLAKGDLLLINGALLDKSYPLTKRVIGLPGDVVEMNGDMVYVNNEVYTESYAYYDSLTTSTITSGTWEVNQSNFFVMGDNRNNSVDSRHNQFGLLHQDDILGKLIFVF